MERLDETDERILAELAQDARATYAEIGQRVSRVASGVQDVSETANAVAKKH